MTGAVVLAAGRGSRFGGGKMLAPVDGRPMLQHVLDLAAEASLSPIVVVLGEDADAIEAIVGWRGETRVRNPAPEEGLSSSLAIGISALPPADALPPVERALVLLGDQPFLGLEQVRALLTATVDPSRPIVVPRYAGQPGNPVLVERAAWPLATGLTGDRGMSQLFGARPGLVRYVDVPGSNPDVDTRADLGAVSRDAVPGRSFRTAGADRSRPSAARRRPR